MPIPFRSDFTAAQVRAAARKTKDGPQARRLPVSVFEAAFTGLAHSSSAAWRLTARTRHAPTIRSLMRLASASIAKGLVSTCMPGSKCPLPTAAFSA